MGSCSSVQKSSVVASVHKREEEEVKVVGSSFSLKHSEFGSKEEMFFDSRAWIDSDCDDDFFSVNGDFTPSRGSFSTANHQANLISKIDPEKLAFAFDSKPETPTPIGRKKLGDLFQELDANHAEEKPETTGETNSDQIPKKSPSGDLTKQDKGEKSPHCCLPSFGISERKQKTSSPVQCNA